MDVQGLNVISGSLSSQFQNLNIESNNMDISNISSMPSVQNLPRNVGNRSISDAGLYVNPFMPSTLRPQTAPISSPNLYGFNYPFNMVYTLNSNNNLMYPQVTSDNLRLFTSSTTSNSSESDSPAVNDNLSIASENSNMTYGTSVNNMANVNSSNPSLSPRPGPVYQPMYPCSPPQNIQYILVPQMQNSVVNIPHSTPPRTTPSPNHHPHLSAVSECPEVEVPYSGTSASVNQNFKDGLSVNVECDDNTSHSWHPPSTNGATNLNYPFMSPNLQSSNFHFSPNSANPYLSHNSPTSVEQMMTPPNVPMFWAPQPSFPMMPVTSFPYQYVQYSQPPDVFSLQAAINEQDKIIKELHSQVSCLDNEIVKCRQEIQVLEKEIKDKSDLPTKEQLESDIADLRRESMHLEQELIQAEEEDFYVSINAGQQGPILPKDKKGQKNSPFKTLQKQGLLVSSEKKEGDVNAGSSSSNSSDQWSCPRCTFLNHDYMKVCEQCELKRKSDETPDKS